ncbi:hypothetical protein ANN_03309 [Periplaneta americana]|uniref:Transposase Tc1-like domain-containing protein n=1 Tax=Periplaneta americana TaxID=6978 RepID=A0ABQ8U1I1_PERAM|nr:hypothetical protein ANN_03309 [Periplaneta americana]
MIQEEHSQRYVARQLGISQNAVSKLWKWYSERHTTTRKPGSGHRRKTIPAEDRYLRLLATRNCKRTAREFQEDFQNATGQRVSDQTIQNRLNENNLRCRRSKEVPRLTRRHKQLRLRFAEEHRNWQLRHWRRVTFCDETKVPPFGNDACVSVWR